MTFAKQNEEIRSESRFGGGGVREAALGCVSAPIVKSIQAKVLHHPSG